MKKTTRILCYVAISLSALWSILAIGSGGVGKKGSFFEEVFIASRDDMVVALALNMVSLAALLLLGAMAVKPGPWLKLRHRERSGSAATEGSPQA